MFIFVRRWDRLYSKHMKLLLLISGLFLLNNSIYGQSGQANISSDETQNKSSENSFIPLFSELEKNGINTAKINIEISNNDLEKLKNFDFSPYRVYNNSQKIQIENGPVIEIYSVEKMINMGVVYENAYILSKKNVDNMFVTHEIMPLVNIGYGLTAAEVLH